MKTSEVLYKAADEIERHGWTSGEGWPSEGRMGTTLCMEGGIAAAMEITFPSNVSGPAYEAFLHCSAYAAVTTYLGDQLRREDGGLRPLWRWNDCGIRTAAEVIETLRAAAVIEAAKENPTAANSPATHADTASEAVTGR